VPSPTNPPAGCVFHTRCQHCMKVCCERAPEMREVKPGHKCACHLFDEGLTEEEKEEQARLRQEYVAAIRGSLRNNLNNISIKEPDGSITDLGKKHGGIKEV